MPLNNKRLSFVNFPIPFDHPYTIPILIGTAGASALLYHSLQASHEAELKEALRQQALQEGKHLKRKQENLSSKFENQFANHDDKATVFETLFFWLGVRNNTQIPKIEQSSMDALPVVQPALKQTVDRNSATHSRQSTSYFTFDGLRILTDQIFDHKNRSRLEPCQIKEIKDTINIVLISHQHVDYLDKDVVKEIGNSVAWYIPLGLRGWFSERGVENVMALDWGQEVHHKERPDIRIACIPAVEEKHSSSQKEESLWCHFVLKSKSDRIFFCGDTVKLGLI